MDRHSFANAGLICLKAVCLSATWSALDSTQEKLNVCDCGLTEPQGFVLRETVSQWLSNEDVGVCYVPQTCLVLNMSWISDGIEDGDG